jgi:hypothetical protein
MIQDGRRKRIKRFIYTIAPSHLQISHTHLPRAHFEFMTVWRLGLPDLADGADGVERHEHASSSKESSTCARAGMVETASMSLLQEIPVREFRRSGDSRRSEERCSRCVLHILRTLSVAGLGRLARRRDGESLPRPLELAAGSGPSFILVSRTRAAAGGDKTPASRARTTALRRTWMARKPLSMPAMSAAYSVSVRSVMVCVRGRCFGELEIRGDSGELGEFPVGGSPCQGVFFLPLALAANLLWLF